MLPGRDAGPLGNELRACCVCVCVLCNPAAGAADEPKTNFGALLKLGALFAGWYLANIYFNM